ncbi:MAG: GNAT family N-acetyltransferase [Planctomycetota bacterium]|nr:GNAT family N-acetyltransferase [Planctomycetota bacterium]
MSEIIIRRSGEPDLDFVYDLTLPFVESGELLKRSREEVRLLIPSGFSAVSGGGEIVGFAAVEIYSKKMAEILCLAVSGECQGQGVGKQLVQHCVEFALQNGVKELMAISSSDHFLKNCGFDYTLPDQKRALFIDPASANHPVDGAT